jgi:hypothetical protein
MFVHDRLPQTNEAARRLVNGRSVSGDRHRQAAGIVAVAEGLERFWEFLTANIRNRNTQRSYYKAAWRFSGWCERKSCTILRP